MLKNYKFVLALIVVIFSVSANSQIENSFYLKKSGKYLGNNFYSPAKYYRINNDTSKFLPNTFYLKLKPNKNIDFLIKSSDFQKLQIASITQPFITKSNNDLLMNYTENLSLIYQIQYTENLNPFEICKILNENENIEYAAPVFKQKLLDFKPNDANYAFQWGLKKIQAEKAWEITKGDSNIIIGHIDSGTDIEHIDLKNKIKFNPNEIPFDKIDNDENGFVDDYMGWDFVGNITYNDAVQNNFKPDNNAKPLASSNSHGTHTAGIIAAETNNSLGIAGIAINCKFLPVKVGMDNMEAPNGSSDIFFGYEAVLYCVRMGCDVINMSWEVLGYSPIEEEIIEYAVQSGATLIAAAGNSNIWADKYETFPAQYKGVISVGSVDEFEKKSSFSNFGYNVDIFAPGSSIYSTYPNSSYGNKSGTSMAAPFVSGAIALLKSIHPNWSNEQIRHQLRATADNSIVPNSPLEPFLFGRLNLYKLLNYNNESFPEYTSPGISVSEIKIKNADEINNFDTVTIKLIVKNYLSSTKNINLNLETGDLSLNIYDKNHTIAEFPANSEQEIEIRAQITDRNLWFKGNAVITLQIKGENYRNYQLLEVPISLPTFNKYFVAYDLPDDFGLSFFAGDSKDDFQVSAIANTGASNNVGYLLNYGKVIDLKKLPGKANCIYTFSDTENIIGSDGKIYISSLTNTKSIEVSNMADKVFGIHFYDENNGFFAGIKANRMMLAKSSDGGLSWNKAVLPSFSGSESHTSNSNLFSAKDSIIFFTSQTGKYAYSTNFGNSWETGVITGKTNLIFSAIGSRNSILLLNFSQSEELQFSHSGDFKTWEDYSAFSKTDSPVYLFSPDSSSSYILLGSHNEIFQSLDKGKNWSVVLSQEYSYNSNSGGVGFLKRDGRVRLWNFSSDLTFLDFDNYPININKNLTNLSEKIVDFGKLKKDSALVKFLFFKNSGNFRTYIESVKITPADNFSENKFTIEKQLASTVASGTIENIQLKFSASENGKYKAMLEIYSDADTSLHKIELIAEVDDSTGSAVNLNERNDFKIFIIDNQIIIELIDLDEISSMNIFDINGKNMKYQQDYRASTIFITPENFSTGVYFINLIFRNKKTTIPIIKN